MESKQKKACNIFDKNKLLLITIMGIISFIITFAAVSYTNYKIENKLKTDIKELRKLIDNTTSSIDIINDNVNKLNKNIKDIKTNVIKQKITTRIYDVNKLESITNVIRIANNKISKNEAKELAKIFYDASIDFKVPLDILLAVAWKESHFKMDAFSDAECIGIMQINPNVWCDKLNIPVELLWSQYVNVRTGAYILRHYYNIYKKWDKSIEAYFGITNRGVEKIYRNKVMKIKNKLNKIASI